MIQKFVFFPVNDIPDLSKGVPVGTSMHNDIPDFFYEGKSFLALSFMHDGDEEDDILDKVIPSYEATIIGVSGRDGSVRPLEQKGHEQHTVSSFIYEEMTLYHGTTAESEALLRSNGWQPNSFSAGCHQGQTSLFYLTNTPEQAAWYSHEKGENCVLAVKIRPKDLRVDPEDGIGENLFEEFFKSLASGLPCHLAAFKPISAQAFKTHEFEQSRKVEYSERTFS